MCWGTIPAFAGTSLGSTAITVDGSGAKASELRYKPYGEVRYSGLPAGTGTDYRFTGQRQLAGLGLYHMGARWMRGEASPPRIPIRMRVVRASTDFTNSETGK